MIRWYVTPLTEPTHFLAGPFETKLEADRKCLLMTSELTKQHAADALNTEVAKYYVSRAVRVEATVLTEVHITIEHRRSEHYVSTRAPKALDPNKQLLQKLTEKLVQMTHSQLLAVATHLDIEVPNPNASRFEITNIIINTMRKG